MFTKLPVGVDGFEKIKTQGFYYVDKTMFISELLKSWGEVNLFTVNWMPASIIFGAFF